MFALISVPLFPFRAAKDAIRDARQGARQDARQTVRVDAGQLASLLSSVGYKE